MVSNTTLFIYTLLILAFIYLLFGGVLKCNNIETMRHIRYPEYDISYQEKPRREVYEKGPGREVNKNCLYGLSVCNMSDGRSGVCHLGGLCMPATHLAQ